MTHNHETDDIPVVADARRGARPPGAAHIAGN